MPQLDILSYFSQFVFLLFTFIAIYYFVITFIMPSTIAASKLRAKFNSTTSQSRAANIEELGLISEYLLDGSFNATSLNLAEKSAASFSVEDLKVQNKVDKQSVQSALMFHYTNMLASKKRLIFSEL